MTDTTKLEKALKQVLEYVASKNMIAPLILNSVDGTENVTLAPLTTTQELTFWMFEHVRHNPTSKFLLLLNTQITDMNYSLSVSDDGTLLELSYITQVPGTSNYVPEVRYVFDPVTDGAIIATVGPILVASHERNKNHMRHVWIHKPQHTKQT